MPANSPTDSRGSLGTEALSAKQRESVAGDEFARRKLLSAVLETLRPCHAPGECLGSSDPCLFAACVDQVDQAIHDAVLGATRLQTGAEHVEGVCAEGASLGT